MKNAKQGVDQMKPVASITTFLVVLLLGVSTKTATAVDGPNNVNQQHRDDDPAAFATMSVVAEDMDDWKEYHDQQLGFGIKYPRHYFHDPQHTTYLSLRQNTTSAEECRTLGKRIGVHIRQLGPGMAFDLAGCFIELTGDATVADIERQFHVACAGRSARADRGDFRGICVGDP